MRRTYQTSALNSSEEIFKYKDLIVDCNLKTLVIQNKSIDLTKTEFDILSLFIKNENKIFSQEDILSRVWKEQGLVVVERTVDVHITRLRKKMGEYGKYILNRTGYGYIFKLPET